MADVSNITDDEYVSPDEFSDDVVKALLKQNDELSKQLEDMKKEKDEAHRYIKDVSVKIASNAELEKENKRLTILNHDLEKRLQAEDKAYVNLWKEVSPSKDNSSGEKTETATSSKNHKEESDTKSGPTDAIASTSQKGGKDERLHELENEMKKLKLSLQETLKIKDKYKKTLEKLRDEKQALSEETSRKLTQRDNKICKTEEKLRLMTAKKDQLEKDLGKANGTAKRSLALVTAEKDQLPKDLEKVKGETEEKLRLMTAKKDQLEKDLEKAKGTAEESLALVTAEKDQLQKDLDEAKGTAERNLALITAEKDQLQKDLDEAKEELNVMAKKLTEGNPGPKSIPAENEKAISTGSESLQHEVDTLRKDLVARDDELRALELKHETLKTHLKEKENLEVTRDDELHSLELINGEQNKLFEEKEYITDNQNETVYFDSLTVQPQRTRKVLEIGLHSLRSGMGRTMTDRVTEGLQKRLKDRLLREKIELHIKAGTTFDDASNGPLFILCLAKSIIGTKVHALEGVTGNKDTVLIIIYYTETDTNEVLSLPIPSFRLYGSELRPLGGTIDMMFSGCSGLYECDVNNSAVERMATFLKKY